MDLSQARGPLNRSAFPKNGFDIALITFGITRFHLKDLRGQQNLATLLDRKSKISQSPHIKVTPRTETQQGPAWGAVYGSIIFKTN